MVRSLAVNAAKGQHRAQRLFSELLAATETSNKRLHDEWVETAISYKVDWERELARRAEFGVSGPEPLPHPNDIEIDMNTGEVIIKGPMTPEERDRQDIQLREGQAAFEQHLTSLRQTRDATPTAHERACLDDDIAHAEAVLEKITCRLMR